VALSRKEPPAGPEAGWGEVEMVGEAFGVDPDVVTAVAFQLSRKATTEYW
jgi:hypothetical protein